MQVTLASSKQAFCDKSQRPLVSSPLAGDAARQRDLSSLRLASSEQVGLRAISEHASTLSSALHYWLVEAGELSFVVVVAAFGKA